MKRSLIILISSATALAFGACNKHSWDEGTDSNPPTKKLFEEHGHGGDEHADHAEGDKENLDGAHAKQGEHPKADDHANEGAVEPK